MAEWQPESKALDPTTWRIAVRQFDVLVRLRADETLMAGKVRGRVKKAWQAKADAIAAAAEEGWSKLKEPPATIGEAYLLDKEVDERCAELRGEPRNV